VTLTDTPTSVRQAAAVPGADTAAVLHELGYDDGAVAALVREGSVALGVPG